MLLLVAMGILVATGAVAGFVGTRKRNGSTIAIAGNFAAAVLLLTAALIALIGPEAVRSIQLPMNVPGGSFYLVLDPLAAFFLLPIGLVAPIAALFARGYLARRDNLQIGFSWFFYNLLIAGMTLVVLAHNAVLFLMAWETMSLASYFLVTLDHQQGDVRNAGWTYLVATHLGTAFLFAMFLLLGASVSSMNFDAFNPSGAARNIIFVFALVGFGTKAGLIPFHVWLPEAHPSAPSHVSAVMSGVMIKTGVYGILRVLSMLGNPQPWWGWLLIMVGGFSALVGVLLALSQCNVKRMLAYSTVENAGIITAGIGLGVIGLGTGSTAAAILGFAGALLHVLNHSLFKGLLFLGAGALQHATGTLNIERMGGLFRRIPVVGYTFLIGSIAISGLPPLNGFAGEFLLYLGATGIGTGSYLHGLIAGTSIVAMLALVGGLASFCFAKAFGVAFLGMQRSPIDRDAHGPTASMRAALAILAVFVVAGAIVAPLMPSLLASTIQTLSGLTSAQIAPTLRNATGSLASVLAITFFVLATGASLAAIRGLLMSRRSVRSSETWGCAYQTPNVRFQYSGNSLSQPVTDLFNWAVHTREIRTSRGTNLFPEAGGFHTVATDWFKRLVFAPVFSMASRMLNALRWIQHGRVHVYILYMMIALAVAFYWSFA